MKIGIITLNQIANYGGIIQAYALQNVLTKMGHDVEVIEKDMYPEIPSRFQKMFIYPWRWFNKKILQKKIGIRKEENQYQKVKAQYDVAKYTEQFVKNHIPHHYIHSFSELRESDYEAYVVGSDQIWRPIYLNEVYLSINDAFLEFTKSWNVKRVSYAASFGSDEWEYTIEQTNTSKELLKCFEGVSCREKEGTEFCKKYLNYASAITVLDPTLLLKKQDYLNLLENWKHISEGNLMCYILDKDQTKESIIEYIASKKGLTPFSVIASRKVYENAPIEERMQPPIEKWLAGFRDAEFVVTDSFHGCVFSIIFRKPFIVIANPNRGLARFKTLLSIFNMDYRLIHSFDVALINEILDCPVYIDESVLYTRQMQSLEFLHFNLTKS